MKFDRFSLTLADSPITVFALCIIIVCSRCFGYAKLISHDIWTDFFYLPALASFLTSFSGVLTTQFVFDFDLKLKRIPIKAPHNKDERKCNKNKTKWVLTTLWTDVCVVCVLCALRVISNGTQLRAAIILGVKKKAKKNKKNEKNIERREIRQWYSHCVECGAGGW